MGAIDERLIRFAIILLLVMGMLVAAWIAVRLGVRLPKKEREEC
jgi:phage shock protein PspC (stress-responsive transcriptional regulator)